MALKGVYLWNPWTWVAFFYYLLLPVLPGRRAMAVNQAALAAAKLETANTPDGEDQGASL
jgi:hypothetical protein